MENIKLEQIDLLMERANVSYSEAKAALEQTNGDIVEALLYLEKSDKIKPQPASCKEKARSFWHKLHATDIIMKKGDRTFINLPGTIALIGFIICLPFSFLGIVIALLYGIKISISGETEAANKINSALNSFRG